MPNVYAINSGTRFNVYGANSKGTIVAIDGKHITVCYDHKPETNYTIPIREFTFAYGFHKKGE